MFKDRKYAGLKLGEALKAYEKENPLIIGIPRGGIETAFYVAQKLNAEMVAHGCGISRRYLSHLLRQNGTSFPNLIWDWRLKTAHDWLSSDVANSVSIAEVAFRIGFKSPAHFSRLFKRVYNMSPREYKTTQLKKNTHPEKKEFYAGSTLSIQ